jgi:hypothetical protein
MCIRFLARIAVNNRMEVIRAHLLMLMNRHEIRMTETRFLVSDHNSVVGTPIDDHDMNIKVRLKSDDYATIMRALAEFISISNPFIHAEELSHSTFSEFSHENVPRPKFLRVTRNIQCHTLPCLMKREIQ